MLSFLFFDASGTILLPHPSIGAIYSDVARSFGVEAEPELLEQGFVRVFRAARHARGLERLPYGSTHEEARAFWRPIVAEAFAHAGLSMPPDPYFDTVYDRFATRHAWRLDDGFSEALQLLRDAGVGVGLLSNFDPRLRPLLHDLDIAHHFEAIVISCEHAAEKPSPVLFDVARKAIGAIPTERIALVGDTPEEDIAGALNAGWRACLVDRKDRHATHDGLRSPSLLEAVRCLLA
jgi:putative hydrolase of the HAD superfamily